MDRFSVFIYRLPCGYGLPGILFLFAYSFYEKNQYKITGYVLGSSLPSVASDRLLPSYFLLLIITLVINLLLDIC